MSRDGKAGKPKTGGRAKGTPNKTKQTAIEKAEALGVDPFEITLLFAKGDWKALGYAAEFEIKSYTQSGMPIEARVIPPELRASSARDASRYLYPVKKAVEVSGLNGEPIRTESSLSPEAEKKVDRMTQLMETLASERRRA